MYPKHRFGLLSWCLLSVLLPKLSYAQTKPSAAFLMNTWREYISLAQDHIHSYHMIVSGTTTSGEGYDSIDTTVLGNKFRVIQTDPKDHSINRIARHSNGFDTELWEPREKNYFCQHHPKSESYRTYLEPFYMQNSPVFLQDLLSSPYFYSDLWKSGLSLITLYSYKIDSLHVVGIDSVNGQECFHVHFNGSTSTSLPVPQDLWFRKIQNYFVPIRVQLTEGTTRTVSTFTRGIRYNGIWLPTQVELNTFFKGTTPSGKTTFAEVDTPNILNITYSDINRNFPESTFHLTCSQPPTLAHLTSSPETTIQKISVLALIAIGIFFTFLLLMRYRNSR